MYFLKKNICCLLTFGICFLHAQEGNVLKDSISIELPSNTLDKAKELIEKQYNVQAIKRNIYGEIELNQKNYDAAINKFILEQELLKKEDQVQEYKEEDKFRILLEERMIFDLKEQKSFSSQDFKIIQEKNQFQAQEVFVDEQEEQKTESKRPTIVFKPKIFADELEKDNQIDSLFFDEFEETINVERRFRGPSQFDSRLEIADLNPERNLELLMLITSNSVGMIVEKEKLNKISSDFYQIDIGNTLQSQLNLCDNVSFGTQPKVGIGSAFVINDDTMLTAAHVFQRPIEEYVVVFGFEISTKGGAVNRTIHKSNIFYPSQDYKRVNDLDIVLFRVSKIINKPRLSLGDSRSLKVGHKIYMIGHPSGLPKKIALNASILDNTHPQYFYTSLDGFQGNSGSPVLNFNTNQVIGILVSGETDYVFNGSCYTDNICREPYCKGEKVIRIENILKGF
ncbi:serine protease [Flagellimonas sp. DF-77]|uniref:trypsin-like serine peptidase n=1 Tax=Flagellimonas algarum TaxID=3230298 RepID=UPI003398C392